jgi:hypothetical protein
MAMVATTEARARRRAKPVYLITVDAFAYAAAALLVLLALQCAVDALFFPGVTAEQLPAWTQVMGPLSLLASIVAGAIGAWLVHGRRLRGRVWLGMLVGLVGGGALLALGFWTLVGLRSVLPRVFAEDSGPWDLIAVVVISTLAFVVPAVVMTLGDLRGQRSHLRADRLRFTALGIGLLLVAASIAIGGETAEAGIFAAGIGAIAAFAALGGVVADRPD